MGTVREPLHFEKGWGGRRQAGGLGGEGEGEGEGEGVGVSRERVRYGSDREE